MPQHEGFLQAIIENPDDDTPRLIYADWLDEHGDSARAEFIRVQCERARTPLADDRWDVLKAREDELLVKHWQRWLAPLRGVIRSKSDFQPGQPEFSRGFVEWVRLVPLVWLHFGEDLLRAEPIHSVNFEGTAELATVLACPGLAPLDALCFSPSAGSSFESSPLSALLASPYTGRLRELSIGTDAEALHALFNSSLYLQLQSLNLIGADDTTVRMLVEAPVSGRLRDLPMHNGGIHEEGMNLLANWPGLKHITSLEICFNYRKRKTFALFQSPFLEAIEKLHLSEMNLMDEELMTLASSPHVRRLRELWLDSNELTPKGIAALAASPVIGQLTKLVLDCGDQEAEALANSPYLTNLRELYFWGGAIQITKRGAEALIASPYLGRQHSLFIGMKGPSDDLRRRLSERFKLAVSS